MPDSSPVHQRLSLHDGRARGKGLIDDDSTETLSGMERLEGLVCVFDAIKGVGDIGVDLELARQVPVDKLPRVHIQTGWS